MNYFKTFTPYLDNYIDVDRIEEPDEAPSDDLFTLSGGITYHFSLAVDSDGDGLFDEEDPCPNNPDCDNDKLTDYQEVKK